MPSWTLEQLLTINKYDQNLSKEASITDKEIESRYKEFGGIFRLIYKKESKISIISDKAVSIYAS